MLTGTNIELTPLERSGLSRLAAWRNRSSAWNGFFNKFPIQPDAQAQWFEKQVLNDPATCYMAIRHRESGEMIGTIAFQHMDAFNQTAEIGNILIGEESFRGKGYAGEALLLMLQYGFRRLNFHRIYLHVRADNESAKSCYERVGFTTEGVLREAFYDDGRRVDVHVMALLRPDAERLS